LLASKRQPIAPTHHRHAVLDTRRSSQMRRPAGFTAPAALPDALGNTKAFNTASKESGPGPTPDRASIAETRVSRVFVPPTIMASILNAWSTPQILLGCTHPQQTNMAKAAAPGKHNTSGRPWSALSHGCCHHHAEAGILNNVFISCRGGPSKRLANSGTHNGARATRRSHSDLPVGRASITVHSWSGFQQRKSVEFDRKVQAREDMRRVLLQLKRYFSSLISIELR
jgi:hypothetical protein